MTLTLLTGSTCYLAQDLGQSIGDIGLRAGLALRIVDRIPVALTALGPYSMPRFLDDALLCEIVDHPGREIVIHEDLVVAGPDEVDRSC